MKRSSNHIMILDAHGVIFNNPFIGFLADVARMTGQTREDVLERWYREVRTLAWTGAMTDEEIWRSLTAQRGDTQCWQALLETHYTLGPVAPMLRMWSQMMPIWILSNHRSHWLDRRLKRFQIDELFERVIVSDAVNLTKPDYRLFEYTAKLLPPSVTAFFVDDQQKNVEAARNAGLNAMRVDDYLASLPSNSDISSKFEPTRSQQKQPSDVRDLQSLLGVANDSSIEW